MPPPHPETSHVNATALPWAPTSFLPAAAKTPPADEPSREVMAALRAVDYAADQRNQREALDQLAAHLTQQARQRGRTPVPKRPT